MSYLAKFTAGELTPYQLSNAILEIRKKNTHIGLKALKFYCDSIYEYLGDIYLFIEVMSYLDYISLMAFKATCKQNYNLLGEENSMLYKWILRSQFPEAPLYLSVQNQCTTVSASSSSNLDVSEEETGINRRENLSASELIISNNKNRNQESKECSIFEIYQDAVISAEYKANHSPIITPITVNLLLIPDLSISEAEAILYL